MVKEMKKAMANKQITQMAIANALKKLSDTMPFEEISVQDISIECGISRKTFYNHFEDKYQLVDWIFRYEIGDKLIAETSLNDWKRGSLLLCRYLKENKKYYENVLNFEGQNSFKEYLYDLTERQIHILTEELQRKKETLKNRQITEEDMEFIINFYYHAFIGEISVWAKQGMRVSSERLVELWIGMVDQTLENFVIKFSD
ncbi:MAG: TetR/AcrR family transcriptional regulator C-terminal domain-containing protein [Velocimicrobium sp.]